MKTFRLLCSKVHLWLGLALSLVLILISLSGSLLVFRSEIDRLLRPDLLKVEPSGTPIGPTQAARLAQRAFPQDRVRLLALPGQPDEPYEAWMAETDRHVYVDPYGARVLGTRGSTEGVMNGLFALHAELLAGSTGMWIVGVSGFLIVLLAATGLVLWWPGWRRVKVGLMVVWRRGWRRLNYDLHRAGGFYTLIFLLLVALTGSGLVFYEQTGQLLNSMTASAPLPPPPSASVVGERAVDLDHALRTAQQELPEAVATFMYLPQQPTAPLTVRLRTPPEWHPLGRSFVYVDPYRGEVMRVDDMRGAPLGTRLLQTLYPLHIGAVGGLAVRWLYALLGLMPLILSLTGVLIWYVRWRKKHRQLNKQAERKAVPARPVAADLPTGPV